MGVGSGAGPETGPPTRKSPSSVAAMRLRYLTDLASCGFVSGENYYGYVLSLRAGGQAGDCLLYAYLQREIGNDDKHRERSPGRPRISDRLHRFPRAAESRTADKTPILEMRKWGIPKAQLLRHRCLSLAA